MKNNKCTLIFYYILFLTLALLITIKYRHETMFPYVQQKALTKNPLDGCVHVYLDMGTNYGHQIR